MFFSINRASPDELSVVNALWTTLGASLVEKDVQNMVKYGLSFVFTKNIYIQFLGTTFH